MIQHALPCPFTECIKILSPFLIVLVMKLYDFFKTMSLESKIIYEIGLKGCYIIGNLFIIIKPTKSQVLHPYGLPMVWYLFPCTVNNMSNFICYNKFQILKQYNNKISVVLMQRIHPLKIKRLLF